MPLVNHSGTACLLALAGCLTLRAEPPAPNAPPPARCPRPACPAAGGPSARAWGDVSYLMWWVTRGPAPVPLVTTGPAGDPLAGVLGRPDTRVLFGGGGLDHGRFSGLKADLGGWLDEGTTLGAEAGGFLLERRGAGFSAASDPAGNPPLAVPFFDPSIDAPTAAIASGAAGQPFAGGVRAATHTRVWGFHANAVFALTSPGPVQVDGLVGYRRIALDEDLSLAVANRDLTLDIQNSYSDRFAARNRFDGGQVGARLVYERDRFCLTAQGQVALGNASQTVVRSGSSSQAGANAFAPGPHVGGILVQPSNAGTSHRDAFAVVPSGSVRVAGEVLPGVALSVGYDFLYWSSVARPGSQVDFAVNTTQSPIFGGGALVGEARPGRLQERTDFWAHGVSFGLEFWF
jgi:hypothetical protein